MSSFKEIVTKAVIGKSKKITHNEYQITPDVTPNTVLGCWVINHIFSGSKEDGKVIVNGSFDINVWYSFNDDKETKVSTSKFSYHDIMPVTLKDNATLDDSSEIIVRSLRQPNVVEVNIIDNQIVMNVEKELGVEIVGDTKLKISVEEEDDDYEVITDDIEEEAIDEVNDEYLDS